MVTISASRGDFFLRPLRRTGTRYGLVVNDPPFVVRKGDYGNSIARIFERVLALSDLPAQEELRYREPSWSFARFAALVEAFPDGSLQLRGLRGRGHGSFVGDGTVLLVLPNRLAKDLPRRLLEALGERPEDIPKLLGASTSRRVSS
jgi:hypothetical protein